MSERLNYDKLYQEALSDPELKRTTVELEAALSNSREAREVVFDLFQDLDGFSLDDYKPLSDVSTGLDRLVKFLAAAVSDRHQRLEKIDDETYDLKAADGTLRTRFTLNRDTATGRDGIDLMGLDHPVMQDELGRWRSLPPENVGISVAGSTDETILMSLWLVETSGRNGERRTVIQAIAVKPDGTRMPAIERQCERHLHAAENPTKLTPDQRLDLFARVVEPTLQRELKHKCTASVYGSYSA